MHVASIECRDAAGPGVQRDTPPGLSKRDAKILRSVQRRAHYLDKGFHVCGMRFGWPFIIGASRRPPRSRDAAPLTA